MPPTNNYSAHPMTEAHEERIQRLEGSMSEIKALTSASSVKMDYVIEKVDQGFKSVRDRLDEGAQRFDQHSSQITKLEAAEQGRTARWSFAKKAVLPLLGTAAGVVATRFGDSIWSALAQLFH